MPANPRLEYPETQLPDSQDDSEFCDPEELDMDELYQDHGAPVGFVSDGAARIVGETRDLIPCPRCNGRGLYECSMCHGGAEFFERDST